MTPLPVDPLALFSLEGRTAIVTGASSGLGARFARALHAAGAHVVIAARRVDRLEAVADELGARVTPVATDVREEADLQRLVDTAVAVDGHLDILVNNAGISDPTPAEEQSTDTFADIVGVNLVAPFALARCAASVMLPQGSGVIVNVASILGLVASAPINDASYAASKAGLVNLTRDLAAQWARHGVRVNAIAPGWFATEMNADMFADERSVAWLKRNTPLARAGHAHELDGALVYLCSDASSYVTGHILVVDGGWTIR